MARRKPGIRPIHSRNCRARQGLRCNCQPTWQADVRVGPGSTGRLRRNFPNEAAASNWRIDMLAAKRKGEQLAPSDRPLREAAADLIGGMRAGLIRNRSQRPYKPSVIRSYDESLRVHVLPSLGALPLPQVNRRTLQRLVDEMQVSGLSASTIRNAINPLRVLFRLAVRDGDVAVNPTTDLDLPAVRSKRRAVAPPEHALRLIDALPRLADQVLWAMALLGGLRRGELMALSWANVDLTHNLIHVENGWDREEGLIAPKSEAGIRDVPIIPALRELLVEWKLACPWSEGLVVGVPPARRSNQLALQPVLTRHGRQRISLGSPCTKHDTATHQC